MDYGGQREAEYTQSITHPSTINMSRNQRANKLREPSATSTFKFVTLSHPDDIRSRKDVQTDIRRHVMKDIGKRRRRPKSSSSPIEDWSVTVADKYASPGRSLPPLGSFPVPTDIRTFELVRFGKPRAPICCIISLTLTSVRVTS